MKNLSYKIAIVCSLLMTTFATQAQVLNLESTTEGALLPRMTTAQRMAIATPSQSETVYDTETKSFWYYENAQWNVLGANSSSEISDIDGDTKIQVEESTDEDMIRFDIGGTEILTLKKSQNNRTIYDISGSDVFIGSDAGLLAAGFNNTFIGFSSGKNRASGSYNVFLGYDAGKLGSTGSSNVFIGSVSGRLNTGNYNTFLGRFSGEKNTGSGNVFLGHAAGGIDLTGSNKLYIENSNSLSPLIYGEFDNDLLRFNGSLDLGNVNSGTTGLSDRQLYIGGAYNTGVNAGSTTGTYKLLIGGYDNEGPGIVYAIMAQDENANKDFYIKSAITDVENTLGYFRGNVAIGTETIAVGHRLSVDGKIACEEVLVDLSGDWPDYVFLDDYKLNSLEEVQAHIDTKGHLPGVPSAQEVEDNGIQVGEMNKVLMEKVEELTLYILQQEKRIKALENSK